MKKILYVEDDVLVGTGLGYILETYPGDIEFVQQDSCEDALAYDDKDSVDLLLLDLGLPGTSGIEALRQIKQHYRCKVVIVSSNDARRVVRETIENGAAGFISKRSKPKDFVAAIYFHIESGPDSQPLVVDGPGGKAKEEESRRDAILKSLTPKELEVLTRLPDGNTNEEIGEALHMSEGTVKAHLSACYRKLEVKNRAEAIVLVSSLGLTADGG